MAWFTNFLTSSIGRKVVMSLTGLFLCLFLVIHSLGNTQLFADDGGAAFNLYTYKMTHSPLIKIASYLTYLSILLHAIQGILLARMNKMASGNVGYRAQPRKKTSFASRNMAFLGVVIFVFIIVHLSNFWYKLKFGEVQKVMIEGHGEYHDMYTVVAAAFTNPWLVLLYTVSMIVLAFHLVHGFQSAFHTLGVTHKKYSPIIRFIGVVVFGIGIPALFAAMPLFFFFTKAF